MTRWHAVTCCAISRPYFGVCYLLLTVSFHLSKKQRSFKLIPTAKCGKWNSLSPAKFSGPYVNSNSSSWPDIGDVTSAMTGRPEVVTIHRHRPRRSIWCKHHFGVNCARVEIIWAAVFRPINLLSVPPNLGCLAANHGKNGSMERTLKWPVGPCPDRPTFHA